MQQYGAHDSTPIAAFFLSRSPARAPYLSHGPRWTSWKIRQYFTGRRADPLRYRDYLLRQVREVLGPSAPGREELDQLRLFDAHSVDPDRYRSYLLRLWREAPGAPWRCQVQCVGTDQEWRFSGLAELFDFLAADTTSGGAETGRQEDSLER
jgi:hypothetical protein